MRRNAIKCTKMTDTTLQDLTQQTAQSSKTALGISVSQKVYLTLVADVQ